MSTRRRIVGMAMAAALLAAALIVATPAPAEAFIHEIIAALCRAGGEEVIPPGQVRDGQSFVRALQATGVIAGFEEVEGAVIIHFDPDRPASKFKSAGFDVTIPDGFAPGVDLILSPLIEPDPDFPAHANCHNLR